MPLFPYPDEPHAVRAAGVAFGDAADLSTEYDPPWPYPEELPLHAVLLDEDTFTLGFGNGLPRCALPGTRLAAEALLSDATRGAPAAAALRLGDPLGTPGGAGPSPE